MRPSARLDALAQAGATVAAGDLHDAAFLTRALNGAKAAFLMIPPNVTSPHVLDDMHEVGEAIAQAVRASGLKKAVHLSSAAAGAPAGTGPTVGLHHQEARLNALPGFSVAHPRPAYFMENLLANIGLVQHLGITGSVMRPDLSLSMVATKDTAARAAELLDGRLAKPLPALPAGAAGLLDARSHHGPCPRHRAACPTCPSRMKTGRKECCKAA